MGCHFGRPFKFLSPPPKFGGPLFGLPTVGPTYFFFFFRSDPSGPRPVMPLLSLPCPRRCHAAGRRCCAARRRAPRDRSEPCWAEERPLHPFRRPWPRDGHEAVPAAGASASQTPSSRNTSACFLPAAGEGRQRGSSASDANAMETSSATGYWLWGKLEELGAVGPLHLRRP